MRDPRPSLVDVSVRAYASDPSFHFRLRLVLLVGGVECVESVGVSSVSVVILKVSEREMRRKEKKMRDDNILWNKGGLHIGNLYSRSSCFEWHD